MTSNDLQNLLNSTAVLGAFLLAGLFLRAKIPFFRRLLVPASVLGGVVGCFSAPRFLGAPESCSMTMNGSIYGVFFPASS